MSDPTTAGRPRQWWPLVPVLLLTAALDLGLFFLGYPVGDLDLWDFVVCFGVTGAAGLGLLAGRSTRELGTGLFWGSALAFVGLGGCLLWLGSQLG